MSKKQKIVIVVNNIDGGVGTFLTQLITLRKNTSHLDMSLLSLKKSGNASLPDFSPIKFFPTAYNRSYYSFGLGEIIQIIQEIIWLKKQISLLAPTTILSVDTHTSLLVCLLKQLFFKKTKIVISNRNNVREILKEKTSFLVQKIIPYMGKVFFQKADKIICVSNGLANDFRDFFKLPSTPFAVLDGIDLHKARSLGNLPLKSRDKKLFSPSKKTIVSVGRLEKQKDFETVIKSIQLVQKEIKNVQLLIIGDGSEKQYLTTLIKKLQLESSVHLLGWKKNVYSYLNKADLFVLSSKYEGFGYVIIEAMSQHIPVLSTKCPFGPSEILENGQYGKLCSVGNSKEIAKGIVSILSDSNVHKNYQIKSKSRSLFFSEDIMLKKYAELLGI